VTEQILLVASSGKAPSASGRRTRLWPQAVGRLLVGLSALTFVTLVCFGLGFDVTPTAFLRTSSPQAGDATGGRLLRELAATGYMLPLLLATHVGGVLPYRFASPALAFQGFLRASRASLSPSVFSTSGAASSIARGTWQAVQS